MADLVSEIASLEARFQHIADLHPWVCLCIPTWSKPCVPYVGELVRPTAPPAEPPSIILDGSGQPLPASKPSLEERAAYYKATRGVRFQDENGREREGSIEEVAKVLRMPDEMESWPGMLKQYGPPPWVMTPRDLQRARVTEHVSTMTGIAERLLGRVLDGPNQIREELQAQLREQQSEWSWRVWICWLRHNVVITGPVWRIENYPQVSATGLMQLREVVGAKRETLTPAANAVAERTVTNGASPANGTGKESIIVVKRKRSTGKGDAETKLISALMKHHKYADRSALNKEPIESNELARAAGVAPASASRFFKKHFLAKHEEGSGYEKYATACRRDFNGRVLPKLKFLNGEYPIDDTYGRAPPGERERDEDQP